jgi:hypothetical protein
MQKSKVPSISGYEVKIVALYKVTAYLDRNIDKAFVFNELNFLS